MAFPFYVACRRLRGDRCLPIVLFSSLGTARDSLQHCPRNHQRHSGETYFSNKLATTKSTPGLRPMEPHEDATIPPRSVPRGRGSRGRPLALVPDELHVAMHRDLQALRNLKMFHRVSVLRRNDVQRTWSHRSVHGCWGCFGRVWKLQRPKSTLYALKTL